MCLLLLYHRRLNRCSLNGFSLQDRELETYNARITGAIEKINEHRRRRAFFLGFSQSPVDFINSLVASQARDLRTASAEGRAECEALRKTEVFQGEQHL